MFNRLIVKADVSDTNSRKKSGMVAGTIGIILNFFLFAVKFVFGYSAKSISIMADAFNNLTDAASSVVTLVGFKLAGKKSDKEHPFGHGRMEYLAGVVVSAIILLVGVELLKSSIDSIINKNANVNYSVFDILILVFAILVKIGMGLYNNKMAKLISSATLKAAARDSFNDCITTFVVLVGAFISYYFGLQVDGWFGLAVSAFIIYSGLVSTKETITPLLGTRPDPKFVEDIKAEVMAFEEIIGIHDLIVHDYGPSRRMISLHAEVSDDSSLVEIHHIIDLIEVNLRNKFNCDVTIHMDPVAVHDQQTRDFKELVSAILSEIDLSLKYHDLRVVKASTHTNIVFDIVVPFDFNMSDEEIIQVVKMKIHDLDESYFAVIQIDRD